MDDSNALTKERSCLTAMMCVNGEIHVVRGASLVGRASRVVIWFEEEVDLSLDGEEEEDGAGQALVSFLEDWQPMKDLHLIGDSTGEDDCEAPVHTLTEILRCTSANNLSRLSFGANMALCGTIEHYKALSATIQKHQPNLQVLDFPRLGIEGPTVFSEDARGFLDPLLPLLVGGESTCNIGYSPRFLTSRGVEAMFSLSHLQAVRLCNHEWPEDLVATAMQCLVENKTLTMFRVLCATIRNPETTRAICQVLEHNDTLQQLDLRFEDLDHALVHEILVSLASSKLRSFALKGMEGMPFSHCLFAAAQETLQKNLYLQVFNVWCSCCIPSSVRDTLDFYLELNKTGQRALLLENPDYNEHQTWVNALIEAKENVSSVFYFLSENPALLTQLVEQQPHVQPVTGKRKRLFRRAKYSEMKRFKCEW
ncbi:expressed unknown protein [Seminavis robusta]|uniref:Uncharacterized protein n=1 Tax=Seminavis robusta TaxID=568900 RepID=A0A9N8F2Q6_9STRA|nr:expressed unknown protein [Seminavis robusta]|eukprot:Sro2787_g337080.1 n/a (424) ;mRNA; f:7518-8789